MFFCKYMQCRFNVHKQLCIIHVYICFPDIQAVKDFIGKGNVLKSLFLFE